MKERNPEKSILGIGRREFFKRAIITAGIATPIVQSFALGELWAGPSNTGSRGRGSKGKGRGSKGKRRGSKGKGRGGKGKRRGRW